jgi:hypothetical protein
MRTGVVGSHIPDETGLSTDVVQKLRMIDASKQQWALEFNGQNSSTPTWEDLARYLASPNGDMSGWTNAPEGTYVINSVGLPPRFIANPNGFTLRDSTSVATPKDPATMKRDECINNLRLIDSAKQQWALEHNKGGKDTPTMEDLKPFLGPSAPALSCPDGGVYTIGMVGEKPTCSFPGHILP